MICEMTVFRQIYHLIADHQTAIYPSMIYQYIDTYIT